MRLLPILLVLSVAAGADYSIPRAAETEFRIVHDWSLKDFTLTAAGKPLRIDPFWLADRIDGNLICTGDHVAAMRRYLAGLDRDLPVVLEMAAQRKGGPRFVAGVWPLTAGRIARDLKLEISGPAESAPGAPLALEVRLVNRGQATYHVVRPNDGSESGWREPAIHFEARRGGGKWVRGRTLGRCGVFARDWQKDVVALKPGAALAIGAHYLPPHLTLDLKTPGEVAIRARYAYRAPDGDTGAMAKTPAFDLASNTHALTIRIPDGAPE